MMHQMRRFARAASDELPLWVRGKPAVVPRRLAHVAPLARTQDHRVAKHRVAVAGHPGAFKHAAAPAHQLLFARALDQPRFVVATGAGDAVARHPAREAISQCFRRPATVGRFQFTDATVCDARPAVRPVANSNQPSSRAVGGSRDASATEEVHRIMASLALTVCCAAELAVRVQAAQVGHLVLLWSYGAVGLGGWGSTPAEAPSRARPAPDGAARLQGCTKQCLVARCFPKSAAGWEVWHAVAQLKGRQRRRRRCQGSAPLLHCKTCNRGRNALAHPARKGAESAHCWAHGRVAAVRVRHAAAVSGLRGARHDAGLRCQRHSSACAAHRWAFCPHDRAECGRKPCGRVALPPVEEVALLAVAPAIARQAAVLYPGCGGCLGCACGGVCCGR